MSHEAADYTGFCAPGTAITPGYLSLESGVSLLYINFIPEKNEGLPEILFLSGLAAVMENFRELLQALTSKFVVHFLETREKRSSHIFWGARFGVKEIAGDIALAADKIFSNGQPYLIIGFSLGATSGAEAIPAIKNKPLRLVMAEPSATFRFPPLIRFLASYFVFLYYPLKPLLKWYMRNYRINLREDYEMYLINCRILDSASPEKISATVREISSYNISLILPLVDVPVIVIGASKDTFHSHNEARQIAAGLKNALFVEMETNKRTHSAEVSEWLVNHLRNSSVEI